MSTNPNPTPERLCDLVMKGGITSGVVYPLAACKLSDFFRFKNIGGTSAGAIAAAATAAAELGRETANGGFRLLADLPEFLGQKPPNDPNPNLFHFFQPQPGTKALFDLCISALGNGWGAVPRVLWAAVKAYLWWFLPAAMLGVLFVQVAWHETSGLFFAACLFIGLFLSIGLGLFSIGLVFFLQLTNAVPANFFGLCTGMEGAKASQVGQPLTPWLTGYLNRLAGRKETDPPITFGDLWGSKDPLAERNINLEMITTCLSHGRPYRLPLRDDEVVHENRRFFFRVDEFKRLFPKHVIDWLLAHPRPPSEGQATKEAEYLQTGFHPLPQPWDMPVVVAVRMSLSFPVLLSAVPLHAIDYTRVKVEDRILERCWFSDGGISSNFPVHFFDSPLPRWPTFAITLSSKHPDYPADIYLPKNNSAGDKEHWTRFEWDPEHKEHALSGGKKLLGFVSAILDSMQNWSDNTQGRLPGFRDRIATVSLTPVEGGLNLTMPPARIKALSDRGERVGAAFAQRFATTNPGSKLDWRNHRWVRLRSALSSLEEMLLKMDRSCAEPLNDDPPYDIWIREAENKTLPSYEWKHLGTEDWRYQRGKAANTLDALRGCSQVLQKGQLDPMPLNAGAPRPRAELRVRPRV
jgi:predicted acylesterase/phospholipase RssA